MRKIMNITIILILLVLLSFSVMGVSEKFATRDFGPIVIDINQLDEPSFFEDLFSIFAIFINPSSPQVGETVNVDLGISVPCDATGGIGSSVLVITGPPGVSALVEPLTFQVTNLCSTYAIELSYQPTIAGIYTVSYEVQNAAGSAILTSDSRTFEAQTVVVECGTQDFCQDWEFLWDIDSCSNEELRLCHDFSSPPECMDNTHYEYRTLTNPNCVQENVCGNLECDELNDGTENANNCALDCGGIVNPPSTCGDNTCQPYESDFNCPSDCVSVPDIPESIDSQIPQGERCELIETGFLNDDSKVAAECSTGFCFDGPTSFPDAHGSGSNTCQEPLCCSDDPDSGVFSDIREFLGFAVTTREPGGQTFRLDIECSFFEKAYRLEFCGLSSQDLAILQSAPNGPPPSATEEGGDPFTAVPLPEVDQPEGLKTTNKNSAASNIPGSPRGPSQATENNIEPCSKPNGAVCTLFNRALGRKDTQASDECQSGICVDIVAGGGRCGEAAKTTGGIEIDPHPTCVELGTVKEKFDFSKPLFVTEGGFEFTPIIAMFLIGGLIAIAFAFSGGKK